jgi:hypothetical protein
MRNRDALSSSGATNWRSPHRSPSFGVPSNSANITIAGRFVTYQI